MARREKRRARRPAKPLLGAAIGFIGFGALFYVMSLVMGSKASPAIKAFAQGIREPIPYLLTFGLAALALHLVLARLDAAPLPKAIDPGMTSPPSTRGDPASTMERPWAPSALRDSAEAQVRSARPSQWSLQVFDDIEWRRFEALCESLFAQAGFTAKTQSHGADGGVDIYLYSRHAPGAAALVVQCKHWRKPVGVKEVREFFGVMSSQKIARGTFATSSTFTEEARRFAKENGISALDGAALLALIRSRTPAQQQELLHTAYEGEYWRPTCASCGLKMVERRKKDTGAQFWGCASYPKCRSTLPMRAALG